MIGLTERQRDLILAIDALTREDGVVPSYGELAHALGMRAKSGINRLVLSLVESGMVRHDPASHRTLCLTGKGHAYIAQLTQDRDLELTDAGALAAEGFVTLGDAALSALKTMERAHGGR